jgi:hypothetical protein
VEGAAEIFSGGRQEMNRDTVYSLQFRGTLQINENNSCPIVATIEFELHDPTSQKIDLHLIGSQKENQFASSYLRNFLRRDYLLLKNEEVLSHPVEVLGIRGYEVAGLHASIVADRIQIGLSKNLPITQNAGFFMKAELTPSGILVQPKTRELSYTGDTRISPIVQCKIEVPSSFGTFEVARRYAHYHSTEYGNDITHSVERLSITSRLSDDTGQDWFFINQTIEEEVRAICRILSFCYRQPVHHYEIEYFRLASGNPRKRIWRRRLSAPESTIKQDELINYRNLVNGGLERLLRNFTNSPRVEEIARAIDFLSSSYKMVTLESSYFLAYSALDLAASIHDPESQYLFKSGKWKKLEKVLRDYLDSIADSHSITGVVNELKQKLPELRRMSGDSRIIKACKALNINTSDLWPREGFEIGLKSATGMRNDLFHSALAEDTSELFKHLVRVRTLVDRLLLKILEWPDDQIWVWYDQNLKFVNQK